MESFVMAGQGAVGQLDFRAAVICCQQSVAGCRLSLVLQAQQDQGLT